MVGRIHVLTLAYNLHQTYLQINQEREKYRRKNYYIGKKILEELKKDFCKEDVLAVIEITKILANNLL